MSENMEHMSHLLDVTHSDLEAIREKEVGDPESGKPGYMGSWKKRGGVGAFMMLARKWDRLEAFVAKHDWDVFEAIRIDDRDEGVMDDVRDLRRYLTLIESECRARWQAEEPSRPPA